MIPYGRQSIDEKDISEVIEVLRSDFITQGSKVREFERALAEYCGAEYAVAVSSGTAALHLAVLVSGLGPGDEAITTPITFLATPNSVLYTGAKPVFADVDPVTANIDPNEIEKKITSKTKAVLPVHYAGFPCDMARIYEIAKQRDLKIIEDACHALGAEYKCDGEWIKVGSCRHSDMTVFSFHPVKHITTGEGGAITTNSRNLYEKLCALRTHGVYKSAEIAEERGPWAYEMRELGFNYRITDFQCALGLSQLRKAEEFLVKRRELVKTYEEEFKDSSFFDLPVAADNLKPSWHLYPVRLKNRYVGRKKEIFKELRNIGVGVQVHYIPVYLQPYYQELKYNLGLCPNAELFYKKEISLPIFPGITYEEITTVGNKMKSVFEKGLEE